MANTIQGIRPWREDSGFDGGDAVARPLGPPSGSALAVRAAADARYQEFVATGETGEGPCQEFMAPGHDYDQCVHAQVPHPVLFQKQGADADAVDARDVQQGGLGDCYFLASLAALAATAQGRALIRGAIVENKDDAGNAVSFAVTLHQPESHPFGKTTFREVHVTVGGLYVIGHAHARPEDGQNEIWPLVLEKAYAQYAGGYNKIGRGGVPAEAMALLTGREATRLSLNRPARWFRSYGAAELQADLTNGKMVVLNSRADIAGKAGPDATPADRKANADAYHLMSCHAYFAQGIEQHDGRLFLKLGNPWGDAQPDLIPYDELSKWFSEISIGSLR